jgi:hypothetical protein
VIAHGGGLDEFAIFFFPVAFGVGFWLLTRKKPTEEPPESALSAGSAAPTPISQGRRGGAARLRAAADHRTSPEVPAPSPGERKDGAARLRQAMSQAASNKDAAPTKPKVRKRRLDGAARLQVMMNGEDSNTDAVSAED